MRLHCTKIVILIIVASLAISAAYAGDYVVKPSAMNGWVLTTITSAAPTSGYAGISTGFVGPAPRACPGVGIQPLPGAFYANLGGYGSTTAAPPLDYAPGQVWLGTNAYSGVALSNISDLVYWTWTAGASLYAANKGQWAAPRQPMGLCLVIKEANPSTVTHKLMFRPDDQASYTDPPQIGFGFPAIPDSIIRVEVWKRWDPLWDNNVWMEFTYGAPTTTCLWTGNWNAILAKYPGATITTPALQIPGPNGGQWPEAQPVNTPNACGLNIQWGAEAQAGVIDGVHNSWPYQPYLNWWRESCNGIGYVDDFEIGVGANFDTYDFEPDVPGHLVASATNWTQDSTGGKAPFYSHVNMEFKVFGKVVSQALTSPYDVRPGAGLTASPNANEFVLDDGGIRIRVFSPTMSPVLTVGSWHAVTGKLMPGYGLYPPGSPRTMRLHARPEDIE